MDYKRYAEIRNSVGMKDFDVSKASGIGSSTFSDWKNGRSNPKEPKLRKIADALGVPYAEFIGYEQMVSDFQNDKVVPVIDQAIVSPAANDVTKEELELLHKYREADSLTRDMIVRLLAFASEQENKDHEN